MLIVVHDREELDIWTFQAKAGEFVQLAAAATNMVEMSNLGLLWYNPDGSKVVLRSGNEVSAVATRYGREVENTGIHTLVVFETDRDVFKTLVAAPEDSATLQIPVDGEYNIWVFHLRSSFPETDTGAYTIGITGSTAPPRAPQIYIRKSTELPDGSIEVEIVPPADGWQLLEWDGEPDSDWEESSATPELIAGRYLYSFLIDNARRFYRLRKEY